MKSLLILTISVLMGLGAYAQNCSKSRTSSSTVKKSDCTAQKKSSCSQTRVYSCTKYTEKKESPFPRFAFLLGPGLNFTPEAVNYSDGSTLRVTANAEGDATSNFLSGFGGQADMFMGVRFRKSSCSPANTFGLWTTAGYRPDFAVAGLMRRQFGEDMVNVSGAGFGEIAAGFVFAEKIRLTTGIGTQLYEDLNGQAMRANYLASTAGLMLPLGKRWVWNTSATVMYGLDFTQVSVRPNTGIMLNFGRVE